MQMHCVRDVEYLPNAEGIKKEEEESVVYG